MRERKKPGVAFWASVVVTGIPILYLLAYGPYAVALWKWRGIPLLPAWLDAVLFNFFSPARWTSTGAPTWIAEPYNVYVGFCFALIG